MELESFLKEILKNCNHVYSYLMSLCYECNTEKIFRHKTSHHIVERDFFKLFTEDQSENNFSVTTGILLFWVIYPLP